ncbi:probable DNA repair protein RAD50 isoform X2 [Hylaeus volcanicus]|uniref:probable DNA repair protein RAD50 isoform X2 n=1 Tax=Hylaeus volcanicus TaxID=313075 RepID=UPI0023B81A63|nr:probable DNA repair protein RAD50 isoform X2 [Hylaeus volcanicus]
MVTLEKLGILGIRSFSPNSLQVLSFEKPLTLIVGHNGAGKTTIVECLRMATTGELPPNAGKGQNFIHNTNSLTTPDIKGQIRLVFKTSNNKKVLANRSFQLLTTRDKKGVLKCSFKALESVLQVKDEDGQVKSINKKCSQMDLQVPQLMHLSPAILGNGLFFGSLIIDSSIFFSTLVIFCHQEDSYWPLGDMSTLKKRFDDIFGATRYSKALGVINILRKDHQKLVKTKQQDLNVMETLREQANLLKKKISVAAEKDDQFEITLKDITLDLTHSKEQVESLKKKLETSRSWFTKLQLVEKNLSSGLEKLQLYKEHLGEVGYKYTSNSLCENQGLQETLKATLLSKKTSLECLRDTITRKESQLDQLVHQKEIAHSNIEECIKIKERLQGLEEKKKQLLFDLHQKYNTIPQDTVENSLCALKSLEQTLKKENEKKNENEKLQLRLTALHEARKKLINISDAKGRCSIRKQNVTNQLQELQAVVTQEPDLTHQLCLVSDQLLQLKTKEKNTTLLEIQERLILCRREQERLQKISKDYLLKKIEKPQQEKCVNNALCQLHRTLKTTCDYLYKRIFNVPYSSVKKALYEIQQRLNVVVKTLEDGRMKELQLAQLNGEMFQLNYTIDSLTDKSENEEKIVQEKVGDYRMFEEKKLSQERSTEQCLKQLIMTQSVPKFYEKNIQKCKESEHCSFCEEPIKDENHLSRIQKKYESRMTILTDKIKTQRQNYYEGKLQLEEYHRQEMLICQWRQTLALLDVCSSKKSCVEKELISVKEEIEKMNVCLKDKQKEQEMLLEAKTLFKLLQHHHDDTGDNCSFPDEMQQATVSLTDDDLNIARVYEELEKINKNINDFEAQLLNEQRVMEELRHEIFLCEEQTKTVKEKLENIEKAKNQIQLVNDMLTETTREFEYLITQTQTLERMCKEYEEEVAYLEEEAKQEMDKQREQKFMLSISIQDLIKLKQEFSRVENQLNSFAHAENERDSLICAYENTKRLLLDLRREQKNHESVIEETNKSLESVQEALAYLNQQTHVNELQKEKDNIEVILSEKIQKLSTERGRILGEQQATKDFKRQYMQELKSNKYNDIESQCRNMLVEFETESMIVRDLQKYHTALDRALMKYHTMKMHSINKTMRELWQSMYKGKDIDYILIRSDTEEDLQLVTTGQRSYNYRVMMVRDGGCELEMRGRCSAGQKVLASIVIRLALAESFGLHCGILALDEPTTNLDEKNMQGLARSLADLIHSRKHCANFQLILITHDEEFVRMLARHQPCDSFYQISKNNDGASIIQRADIHTFHY